MAHTVRDIKVGGKGALYMEHNLRVQCCKNCMYHYRYSNGPYRCSFMDKTDNIKMYWVCDLWKHEPFEGSDSISKENEDG